MRMGEIKDITFEDYLKIEKFAADIKSSVSSFDKTVKQRLNCGEPGLHYVHIASRSDKLFSMMPQLFLPNEPNCFSYIIITKPDEAYEIHHRLHVGSMFCNESFIRNSLDEPEDWQFETLKQEHNILFVSDARQLAKTIADKLIGKSYPVFDEQSHPNVSEVRYRPYPNLVHHYFDSNGRILYTESEIDLGDESVKNLSSSKVFSALDTFYQMIFLQYANNKLKNI